MKPQDIIRERIRTGRDFSENLYWVLALQDRAPNIRPPSDRNRAVEDLKAFVDGLPNLHR